MILRSSAKRREAESQGEQLGADKQNKEARGGPTGTPKSERGASGAAGILG